MGLLLCRRQPGRIPSLGKCIHLGVEIVQAHKRLQRPGAALPSVLKLGTRAELIAAVVTVSHRNIGEPDNTLSLCIASGITQLQIKGQRTTVPGEEAGQADNVRIQRTDRKSTRLNSSHVKIS